MLWNKEKTFFLEPFDTEKELESAILEISSQLFGPDRIYLDIKKKIGSRGKTNNIPDGYLVDLSSAKEPKLYVVENEISKHEPIKHIAVQILKFSLSFETSQHQVKNIVKNAILNNKIALLKCQKYIDKNGFDNIDYLIEKMIYSENGFNALVIIDELSEELEKVLQSRFQFPVEILTIERYKTKNGERIYRFDPFLNDLTIQDISESKRIKPILDPSELDTIVVPAREEGFQDTFLGENRWYAIRVHSSMIPKIKYIAAYRVSPESAITHIAPVASIEPWKDTNKYVVIFSNPAQKIAPIRLIPKGDIKAPQAPRYTSYKRLMEAKNLDEAF